MSLRFRYASFLLLVLLLLAAFSSVSVFLVYKGGYIAATGLLALLFFTTYFIGRRCAGIFFTLSFLRLLRQNHGVFTRTDFEHYMERSTGGRRNHEQKQGLEDEILQTLENEGLISINGETILLLEP